MHRITKYRRWPLDRWGVFIFALLILNYLSSFFLGKPTELAERFICLKDEPELWKLRMQRINQFQDEYCDGKPLDKYVEDDKPRGLVPVIFVFEIMGSRTVSEVNSRLISMALNTAAKFNDRVILLLFGRSSGLQIKVSANVEIVEIYKETDPVLVAFKSFGPPLYVHMSSNLRNYELFCFRRWFGIQAFLQQRKIQHAFIADNDVLLLSNVTRDVERCFVGCRTFGHRVFSVFVRSEVIDDFLKYMLRMYREPGHVLLKQIAESYHVVSDMTVFLYFSQHFDPVTKEVYAHPHCTQWPSPLKSVLTRHDPFEGLGFLHFNYSQDELQLATLTHPHGGPTPHLLQNLHFQGRENKQVMARCPEIEV